MIKPCKKCGEDFIYEVGLSNRTPSFCTVCKLNKRRDAVQAQVAKRKGQAGKLGLRSKDMCRSIASLTVRTHTEVAAIMCISQESSRCLERSAMTKIRKFFKLDLLSKQLDNSLRTP